MKAKTIGQLMAESEQNEESFLFLINKLRQNETEKGKQEGKGRTDIEC